jgi:acetylornithine deacetylase/succinyl-diaminopimelate desuccinylase-like protein
MNWNVLLPGSVLMLAVAAIGSPNLAAAQHSAPRDGSRSEFVRKAPPPKPIDYDRLTQEATTLLSQYIKVDTTNPPGNELPAARLLREKFLGDGIPATVWEPQPGRGIVAARLRGGGRHSKAIVLLSHMDVVPANPSEWRVPPFSGEIKDGDIWGRGALDDKGPGVIELMAMLALKRSGILLDRDLIFIATGDEEQGGKNGAGWLVEHQPGLFADAGNLLNEGGGILSRPNGRRFYAVSVTEKTPLWLRLTASGPAGHAAVPPQETSVSRLVHALDRLIEYHPAIRLIDPVRDYFRAMAELDGGPSDFLDLRKALRDDPDFTKKFLSVPRQNALVRDTITPTVLSAGQKTNIIPTTASAEIDCRLLPGEDAQEMVGRLRKVIDDTNIKIDVLLNFPAVSSPRNSHLMTAIDQLAKSDNARVVPTMISGFTDSHYFRQKGLIAYGFIPLEITPAGERGVHGVNERMPIQQLGGALRRMVELLETAGGRPQPQGSR